MDNVDLLLKSISKHLTRISKGDTIQTHWPFTAMEAEMYIGKFIIKDLYATLSVAKENMNINKIAKYFYRPSSIAQYIIFLHSAKVLEKQQRLELTNDIIDIISYYRTDPFCVNYTNTLKKEHLANIKFKTNSLELDDNRKVSALLYSYLELLYPTVMRLGYEYHGPYLIDGKNYCVKEFYNLKNRLLGNCIEFPYSEITIVSRVKDEPEVDFFGHLVKTPVELESKIFVNGLEKNSSEVLENISIAYRDISNKLSTYSKKDWLLHLYKGFVNQLSLLNTELNITPDLNNVEKYVAEKEFTYSLEGAVRLSQQKTEKELEEIIFNSFSKIFCD